METMSQYQGIDVIGIGAVNYDYVAPVSKYRESDERVDHGTEHLSRHSSRSLEELILSHYYNDGFVDRQIGGSAYLAVKTISHLDDFDLNTAYVGVVSSPDELERDINFFSDVPSVDSPEDVMDEFAHLSDDEWLFEADGPPGRALVELNKGGKRDKIPVGPGSNGELVDRILAKEAQCDEAGEEKPFTRYLASARWIHLTSFSDFEQFQFFVERIRDAKRINPHLRVSIDPGDEYTDSHTNQDAKTLADKEENETQSLKNAFEVSDFVFMTEDELIQLSGSSEYDLTRGVDVLKNLSEADGFQTIVLKEENRNLLINFVNREPYYRYAEGLRASEYWHRKISSWNIKNDTGAGDALAGGVIAGLLSPTTLAYKPVPVEIGSSLAREVLKSHEFPVDEMNDIAMEVVTRKQEVVTPSDGFEKRIRSFCVNHSERIQGLALGILASGIVAAVGGLL